MIKLLGAVMILGVCIAMGYLPVNQTTQRIMLLRQLEQDLNFMYAELHTNLMPIPELIRLLAEQKGSVTRSFYQSIDQDIQRSGAAVLSDAWRDHTVSCLGILNAAEQKKLNDLGMCLGKYALEDELELLENAADFFRASCQETRIKHDENKKVSLSLGAALGVFLVIALI